MKSSMYYLLLFAGVLAASFSQVLLKKAAGKQHKSFLREYLNPWVIGGYMRRLPRDGNLQAWAVFWQACLFIICRS